MITAQDNATLVRTVVEAYNDRAFDKAGALFAPDATCLNVALNAKFVGPTGYKEFLQNWATAYPDSKVEVVSVAAGDEYAAVEYFGRGTNTGSFKSPEGTIPATGKKVDIRICQMFRIKNGKITETRHYFDAATLMRQLGLAK